ncbi:MAG: hypothetical protein LBF24_00935, partial [Puniceicoccales bacterium]|nr:hypothetical protein [Puniceicoccales bacterium]
MGQIRRHIEIQGRFCAFLLSVACVFPAATLGSDVTYSSGKQDDVWAAIDDTDANGSVNIPARTFAFTDEESRLVITKSLAFSGAELDEFHQPTTIFKKDSDFMYNFLKFSENTTVSQSVLLHMITFDGTDSAAANVWGGAVYYGGNTTGNITNCKFIGNETRSYFLSGFGGAVDFNSAFTGEIDRCTFIGNSIQVHALDVCGFGGAVRAECFCGKITNSIFTGNVAGNGGGISVGQGFTGSDGEGFADLGGTFFLKNYAEGIGGAAYCGGVDGNNIKVAALSGDVVVQGNLFGNLSESSLNKSERPGGFHFGNHYNAGITVGIAAAESCTFWNYDPLTSGRNSLILRDHNTSLSIVINPESDHTGTVLFDRHRSDVWFGEPWASVDPNAKSPIPALAEDSGSTYGATVSHGTMVLQNGASFGAGESNFFNDLIASSKDIYDINGELIESIPANGGPFRLCESATLRIAYGQPIDVYEFDESILAVTAHREAVPYDPDFMRSEINAGTVELQGKLHFVLPSNVIESAVMLEIPYGTVTVADSATIDVGVNNCDTESFHLLVNQLVVLLNCDAGLRCNESLLPVLCDGSTIPDGVVRESYKFSVWKDGDKILAELLSTPNENLGENASGSNSSDSSGSGSFRVSGSSSSGSSGESASGSGSSDSSDSGSFRVSGSSSSGSSGESASGSGSSDSSGSDSFRVS